MGSYKKVMIKFKNIMTDPIKFKHFVQTNKKELSYWVITSFLKVFIGSIFHCNHFYLLCT